MLVRHHNYSFYVTRRHKSHTKLPDPLFSHLFALLFPEPQMRECFVDMSVRTGSTTLHVDWL